jgi:two-component system response regulator YesN
MTDSRTGEHMHTVLVVDDEPMAREAIRMAADWEEYGFTITGECENGEDALHLAGELHPDVILTDIRMPDMDGLALVQRVFEEIGRETVFIMISGYDEFAYAKKALQLGIRYFLLKPVFEEDLSAVLTEVLYELERREEMTKIAAESTEALLDMFFDKLLAGHLSDEEIHGDLPQSLPSDGEAIWTYAALLACRPDAKDRDEPPSSMGYDDLKKAIQAFGTADTRLFTVFYDAGLYGLILCSRSSRAVSGLWQEMVRALDTLYKDGFYLAVGNPVHDIEELPASMKEADTALEHRFFYPPGSVLLYGEIKDRSLNYSFKGIHYIESLIDALENLDQEEIIASITTMFDAFRQSYMAPEIVKMHVVNIVYRSFNIVSEMGGTPEEISLSGKMSVLLGATPSLNEIENILREYAQTFCRYTHGLRNRDSLSLMHKVEDYIRSNYKRSLTVKEIARKLFVHPTYLGHQIYKWFGCGFNEYLHKMRMKEAAQLISGTGMKIHEIATGLGYTSYNSFLEQFVRYYTMKPTEFRQHKKG